MINRKNKIENTHFKFVDLREDNDLKQKDVAKELGIKRSRYSMWEIGERDFSIEYANKLANFYNVNLDYLFGLSNKKNKNIKKEIDYNLLSGRLKLLRKEKHLSQAALGKEIGLSQRACSHYEKGDNIPTSLILLYFAQFFKVSMDFLVGRSDVKEIKNRK